VGSQMLRPHSPERQQPAIPVRASRQSSRSPPPLAPFLREAISRIDKGWLGPLSSRVSTFPISPGRFEPAATFESVQDNADMGLGGWPIPADHLSQCGFPQSASLPRQPIMSDQASLFPTIKRRRTDPLATLDIFGPRGLLVGFFKPCRGDQPDEISSRSSPARLVVEGHISRHIHLHDTPFLKSCLSALLVVVVVHLNHQDALQTDDCYSSFPTKRQP
jgi:hypothetical protein